MTPIPPPLVILYKLELLHFLSDLSEIFTQVSTHILLHLVHKNEKVENMRKLGS